MRPFTRALSLAAALALAACGALDSRNAFAEGWNPVGGMICADGSSTGIGVSLGTSNRVLVYLAPGGACWAGTCSSDTLRSFGANEYLLYSSLVRGSGTILDRTLPGNPFADWTHVFVPYCTGDVHAGGDVTMTYGTQTWRHHGRANLEAALSYVAAAIPSPGKVVIAGSSAGGFGSLLAFDIARAKWPAGAMGPKAYLVDDSGQTFVGNDLPQALRDAWWASWNLAATITPLCPTCQSDLSELWTVLHAAHPTDRLALLTSTQDSTMSGFFGLTPTQFQTGVTNLASKLQGIPDAASFQVAGSAHALLANAPASYSTASGTSLLTWLGLEVNDDAGWTSVGP